MQFGVVLPKNSLIKHNKTCSIYLKGSGIFNSNRARQNGVLLQYIFVQAQHDIQHLLLPVSGFC